MPRRRLSDVLFALADPTRIAIVERVAAAPCRASELAEAAGVSRPSMSRHLRILREAGVLRDDDDAKDGRARLVSLDRAPLDEIRAFLDEVDGFWESQLASFSALAETRGAERRAPAKKSVAAKRRAS